MTSLALLLVARDGGGSSLVVGCATAGPVLLVGAAYLTLHSLVAYMRALWPFMA